ncbi:MAG: carboxypeptidase regulatory-like domain-containing protein [Acidobacteriota bacterium]|nr:carboxypeptidase regulatory-like domain-containing protein [Acidobacteriota bacterium]
MSKVLSINFLRVAMLAAFCLIAGIGGAAAQAEGTTGQITGVVTDPNGAVVPNATVTATNKGTNQTQTQTTSSEGVYRFVLLQPGQYTVTTSSSGFAQQTVDVEVQVGRTTDVNVTLGAAGATAQVEVTAEGVQTTTSNSDAVIDETAISNLPINGRRFQDFVTLTPSAQVEGSRGQISLSGQRGINGNVNVDGVDFNQPFFGGIRGGERSNQAFTIPQEAIKEFQVVAAGYSAEFGRSTGGIVNAVTKSGTNDVRGSLFYLWRPEQLARGNEYTRALEEQRLNAIGVDATLAPTQHQFGGSIGGPIIRDRLFYFASYEQQRFRAPRQVLFGSLAGLTIPAGDRALEAFNFLQGLETPYEQTNDAYALLGRVDWNINNNNRLNGRFNFSRNDALNAAATGETTLDPTTNSALSANGIERNRNYITVGQLISNFGAATINELRMQFAREERPREANELAPNVFFGNNFGQYGSRNFLPTTQYDKRFQIADALTYVSGDHTFKFGGEFSHIFAQQQFGFDQFGAYSLTSGGTLDILRNISSTRSGNYLGRFDVAAAGYNRQIGNLQAEFVGKEAALFAQDSWRITPRFTLNYGLRVEQQFNPSPEADNTQLINVVRNTNFPIRGGGFDPTQIPDSGWQFGPRLGFAYDPTGDGKTVIRGFSGIYYARTPGLLFADSVNNFRTVPGNVRTFLEFTGFNQATFNTFAASAAGAQYRNITGCNPTVTPLPAACIPNTIYRQFAIVGIDLNTFSLNNLPNVTPEQISGIASALGLSANPFVGAQVTGHAEDFKNPRSYQFGFAFERELATNFVVGVDYSFVKTDRLQRNRDLNVPSPLTGEQYRAFLQANNTAANYNAMVASGIIDQILQSGRTYIAINTPAGFVNPTTGATINFPTGSVTTRQRPTNNPALNPNNTFALGSVQVRESTGKSLYQALTLRTRLNRRWVQLNAYYTLSKNESDDDNERDSGGVAYANPYDLSGEYGPSRLDRRHQFVANPVFFLPYGFEVSSAIRLRSGTPINAYAGADLNGDNVFNDRPLSAPGVQFNRNAFRNRPIYDVDMRVQKGFNFDERRRLVLSAEFFNVFNTPNIVFQFPGTNSTSGPLGQYCSVGSQLCGLNGPTNVNFLQIREQNPASSNFGNINLSTNPGSQVFQVQFGARFQF